MVEVDAGLLAAWAANSGACHVVLRGADETLAVRAMNAAARAVQDVPHPEEPDDPFVSFVSEVAVVDDGVGFWFDAADAEAYDDVLEALLSRIVAAVEAAGAAEGVLAAAGGGDASDSPAAESPAAALPPEPTSTLSFLEGFPLPPGVEGVAPHRFSVHGLPDPIIEFYEQALPYPVIERLEIERPVADTMSMRLVIFRFRHDGGVTRLAIGSPVLDEAERAMDELPRDYHTHVMLGDEPGPTEA